MQYTGSGSAPAQGVVSLDQSRHSDGRRNIGDDVSTILRGIPGNNVCAECNSPEPDWASLNLGVLLCIQCSGVHRNLGVHISKVWKFELVLQQNFRANLLYELVCLIPRPLS